ncbi:fimbrial protein, partial [Escherichia coli]|nr:fimbrial protein [Escherichia coli]
MHWMHLPLYHYRAHFSFSLLALTIASSLPAYGGKFNPKFLENVQGIDQHIDLSV